jgi:dihydroxy-acid dehydratase
LILFQKKSYGESVYDRITEEERLEIIQNACPGPGACGGMYTANTMATAIEALGSFLIFYIFLYFEKKYNI